MRKHIKLEFPRQLRVGGMKARPIKFYGGDKPQRKGCQSGMMHPGVVFESLKLIPSQFCLAVPKSLLDEETPAFQKSQLLQGCIGGGVAKRVSDTAVFLSPDKKPFFHDFSSPGQCEDPPGIKMVYQKAPLNIPEFHFLKLTAVIKYIPYFNRLDAVGGFWTAIRLSFLSLDFLFLSLFGLSEYRPFKIDRRIRRGVKQILDILFIQPKPEIAGATIDGIANKVLERNLT